MAEPGLTDEEFEKRFKMKPPSFDNGLTDEEFKQRFGGPKIEMPQETKPVLPAPDPNNPNPGNTPLRQFGEGVENLSGQLSRGVKNVPGDVARAYDYTKDFVTREGKFAPVMGADGKPLPELLNRDTNPLKLTGRQMYALWPAIFGTAVDDDGAAKIVKNYVPDAEIDVRDGIVYVTRTVDGKTVTAVLNNRGLSSADTASVVAPVIAGGPAARAVAGAKTVGGAMMRGAGAAIGTDLAMQAHAKGAGSDQPFDFVRAGGTGAIGGGASGVLMTMMRAFRSGIPRGGFSKDGTLSPAMEKHLRANGINPDDLPKDFVREARAIFRPGTSPEEAIRIARSRGHEIDLTGGQKSADPAMMRYEFNLKSGGKGETLTRTERDVQSFMNTTQPRQYEAAKQILSKSFTGGEARVGSFEKTLTGLSNKVKEHGSAIRTLYKVAEEADTRIAPGYAKSLVKTINKSTEGYPLPVRSAVANEVKLIDDVATSGQPTQIKLSFLEERRKALVQLSKSSDPPTASAARNALKAYDKHIGSAGDNGMVVGGDPAGMAAYREARRAARQANIFFGRDPKIKKILDVDAALDGNGTVLKLDPEEAVTVLLGKGGTGTIGSTRSVRIVKAVLGKDSEEWQALRSEVMARVLKVTPDDVKITEPVLFRKQVKDLFDTRPTLAKALFSPEEMQRIRSLAATGDDISTVPSGTFGRSGTGQNVISRGGLTGGRPSQAGALVKGALEQSRRIIDPALREARAVRSMPTANPVPGPVQMSSDPLTRAILATGAGTATANTQNNRDLIRYLLGQ